MCVCKNANVVGGQSLLLVLQIPAGFERGFASLPPSLQLLFAKGLRQFGKNFYKIKTELLPDKEVVSRTIAIVLKSRKNIRNIPLPPPSPPPPPPLPSPPQSELTEHYYLWKKSPAGLTSRNTRRQRKQTHIRLSRSLMKPNEASPEREFSTSPATMPYTA